MENESSAPTENFDVSCRGAAMFFKFFEESSLPLDELVTGTGFAIAHWQNHAQRVHWQSYVTLLDNAARHIDATQFEELGFRNVFESWSAPYILVARALYPDATTAFRQFVEPVVGIGTMVVRCFEHEVTDVTDTGLTIRQAIWPGRAPSLHYAHYSKGVLAALPVVLYWRKPEVELEVEGTTNCYKITYRGGSRLFGNLRRLVFALFGARKLVPEIQRSYTLLQQRFLEITAEIKRREAAENALRESEERFRHLVEHGEDIVLIIGADLSVSYMSPHLARLLKIAEGEDPRDHFIKKSRLVEPQLRALIDEASGYPGETRRCQILGNLIDGEHVFEGFISNRVDNPAVRGFVFEMRDRTEQNQLRDQLERAGRMEAIGRMAGGVAHDFNNLLQVINGRAELALAKLYDPAKALQEILRASDSAAHLTRELLTIGRQSEFLPVSLDLSAWLQDREVILRAALPSRAQLTISAPEEKVLVVGDPSQLEQVLLNLVLNAADAIERTGVVMIRIDTEGDQARLVVIDNGVGMDEETSRHIYEPFFTTKKDEGTGLGLATAFAIVERHQGNIELISAPGEGTEFRIRLPLADRT